MRGALKHLAHVETCSPPRTSDGCQKLLNAYKLIRELKGVDKEEKKLLNDAVDDLRTILQVSQYLLIIRGTNLKTIFRCQSEVKVLDNFLFIRR